MYDFLRMKAEKLRYERKFRIEHLPVDAVHQAVRMLPWGLRPLFPDRRIHNMYFDTPNLDTYRENAIGVGQRKKFRLRWYGETDWPEGEAVFEIKERYLERGKKKTHAIDPGLPDNLQDLVSRIRALEGIPSSIQPVLVNSYARSYYGLPSGTFRITIDWDQRFGGLFFQHPQRNMQSPSSWMTDPAVILELKYDAALDEEIDPILQNLPFRFSKNSKYVQGVEMLYGKDARYGVSAPTTLHSSPFTN